MPRRERLYRPPSQPIAQSTQNFVGLREFLLLSGLPPKLKAPAYKIKLAGIILYAFHRMNILTAINIQCDLWIDSNTSSLDSQSSVLVQARRQSIRFLVSRDRRIRTFDHSAPNGALYQTELHPDEKFFSIYGRIRTDNLFNLMKFHRHKSFGFNGKSFASKRFLRNVL